MHLGSPILVRAEPYRQGVDKGLVLIDKLRAQGTSRSFVWNMGGAASASITKSNEALPATAFAEVIVPGIQKSGCKLVLEPGRFIVGNAGLLVSRVIYNEGFRRQALRHPGRGDERSDPPDAV